MEINMSRRRVTSATQQRADNIRRLIKRLQEGELARDDFEEFMGMSASGSRKYISELLCCGVMVVDRVEPRIVRPRGHSPGQQIFRITTDADKIARLLACIDQPRVEPVDADLRRCRQPADPTRHVHIMADDGNEPIRVHRLSIPAPDPLLAHFFGMAGAQAAE